MLKIVTVPNTVLSSPTKAVEKVDGKIKKLIKDMEAVLVSQDDPPGVGLAANQVGVNLSVFIIRPTLKSKTKIFINPRIVKIVNIVKKPHFALKKRASRGKPVRLEGCLSIPRIWGPVKRAKKVLLEYQDLASHTEAVKRSWFQGFEATIIQHEMDHLNGLVFTQRSLEQKQSIYEEKDGQLEKITEIP